MSARSDLPVTVCGHKLTSPRHICCFFDSRDQQYEVLMPYFQEGLANGEKVFCVMENHFIQEHRGRLCASGIDVPLKEATGHLQTATSDDAYLAGGRFDKTAMYNILADHIKALEASPFPALRTCGDMEWALRNMPGTDQLMEYESEVNRLLVGRNDVTFACVYDANRISGKAMLDILSTHSHIVIGKTVHENQYCMTPDEYAKAFLTRRAASRLEAG